MRKRLFLAVVCMLTVPTWFSDSPYNMAAHRQPFGGVAIAGHSTLGGGWCGCGTPGCICDVVEQGGTGKAPLTGEPNGSDSDASSALDPGASVLMLALAFLLWTRLRA